VASRVVSGGWSIVRLVCGVEVCLSRRDHRRLRGLCWLGLPGHPHLPKPPGRRRRGPKRSPSVPGRPAVMAADWRVRSGAAERPVGRLLRDRGLSRRLAGGLAVDAGLLQASLGTTSRRLVQDLLDAGRGGFIPTAGSGVRGRPRHLARRLAQAAPFLVWIEILPLKSDITAVCAGRACFSDTGLVIPTGTGYHTSSGDLGRRVRTSASDSA
jgi:hypothetical protein